MTILENLQQAHSLLKRIVRSKGGLQGNFFFTSSGSAAALAITLRARDKKGATIKGIGKTLRSTIKGTKVARGLVFVDDKKLVFEIHTGTAAPKVIKTGFVKWITNPNAGGLKDLHYIKKSAIRRKSAAGETPPVSQAEGNDSGEELDLNAADFAGVTQTEIDELTAEQATIAENIDQQADAFLSMESAVEEEQIFVGEMTKDVEELEHALIRAYQSNDQSQIDRVFVELNRSRTAIAQSTASGVSPLSAYDDVVTDVQLMRTIEMSTDNNRRFIQRALDQLEGAYEALQRDVAKGAISRDEARSQLQQLKQQAQNNMNQMKASIRSQPPL